MPKIEELVEITSSIFCPGFCTGRGGGGGCPPWYSWKKVPFFASRCPFFMPNHHQQGALLDLGLPPPNNFRLRTTMAGCPSEPRTALSPPPAILGCVRPWQGALLNLGLPSPPPPAILGCVRPWQGALLDLGLPSPPPQQF